MNGKNGDAKDNRVWPAPDPDFEVDTAPERVKMGDALNEAFRRGGGYWYTLALKKGPSVAKEKLVSCWNVMALISALFTALTMPVVTSPPLGGRHADDEERDAAAVQVFIITFHVSLILSFFVIMGTLACMTTMDLCVTDSELLHYIDRFHVFHEVLFISFAVSFLSMIAGVLAIAWYNYSQTLFIIICTVYISLAVLESIYAVRLDILTKGRLVLHRLRLEKLGLYADPTLLDPKAGAKAPGPGGAQGRAEGAEKEAGGRNSGPSKLQAAAGSSSGSSSGVREKPLIG